MMSGKGITIDFQLEVRCEHKPTKRTSPAFVYPKP